VVTIDGEGRVRRAIYMAPELWAWVEKTAEEDEMGRSDLMEGLVLLAMDADEDPVTTLDRRAGLG